MASLNAPGRPSSPVNPTTSSREAVHPGGMGSESAIAVRPVALNRPASTRIRNLAESNDPWGRDAMTIHILFHIIELGSRVPPPTILQHRTRASIASDQNATFAVSL